jgi:uncharacterized protein YuzE
MTDGPLADIQPYLDLIPAVRDAPRHTVWVTYDSEADVLYINFRKPSHATDSELTEDDVIIRRDREEVVGLTVLHASQRGR